MWLKRIGNRLIAVVLAIALVLAVAVPVLAGLKVSPVSMEGQVGVGESSLTAITVTNTDGDKPVRVTVEVMGFGQTAMGSTFPVKDDTSPCSAVSLIKVSPEEFDLEPGESQQVMVTATIPQEASGGKYATIVVGQVPEPGVSMVGQVAVAVILTIAKSTLVRAGQIMSVDVRREQPGEPLTFITSVCNQGNVHFRPIGEIIIGKDGQEVGRAEVEPHLILPEYTRQLKILWDAPEVKAGTYSFEVILNVDGTELRAEGSFTLSETGDVVKVEGGVGEPTKPGEAPVPPQKAPPTPGAPQPINWEVLGAVAGGVLILGLLIYLLVARERRGYR